jgi:hypothetical protein
MCTTPSSQVPFKHALLYNLLLLQAHHHLGQTWAFDSWFLTSYARTLVRHAQQQHFQTQLKWVRHDLARRG